MVRMFRCGGGNDDDDEIKTKRKTSNHFTTG